MTVPAHQPPIVVGVDGSASAISAVKWAARESNLRNAALRTVHVTAWLEGPEAADGVGEGYRRAAQEQAQAALTAAVAAAEGVAPGIDIGAEVLAGDPIDMLQRESASARLLALGSRGLGGFSSLLVGSVADTMAATAGRPVVVIRGSDSDAPPATGPLIVGLDHGPGSDATLAFAFDSAAVRGVPLVAVHAWEAVPTYSPLGMWVAWDTIGQDQERKFDERLRSWSQRYPEVSVSRIVAPDRPARMLLQHAGEAQLLVVGSRGRGPITGLLLGSTSRALLHHARCPLAVVRSGDAIAPTSAQAAPEA